MSEWNLISQVPPVPKHRYMNVEVKLHSFYTSVFDGGDYPCDKIPSTHFIEDRVASRADMNGIGKWENSACSCRDLNLNHPVLSQSHTARNNRPTHTNSQNITYKHTHTRLS
jgi:hypothetical protein